MRFYFGVMAGAVLSTGVAAQEMTLTQEQIDGADACQSAAGVAEGQTLLCTCAPDAMRGSVWGTAAYTSDSSVCAAALHAGAVPPEGGAVVLTGVAGQDKYSGSTNNGITSRDWGAYGSSFQVAAAQVTSQLAECGVMPVEATSHACHCPPAKGNAGRVWGYGPYTADSDICSAARHAGYIEDEGGTVTVLKIQGLESYTGGLSNGIETSDWGPYGRSIIFDWNQP